MAFWSRLRSLLGLDRRAPTSDRPADSAGAADPPATADEPHHDGAADPESPGEPEPAASDAVDEGPGLAGIIDDWTAATASGLITLTDGAALAFDRAACQNFSPFIGLRVEVVATGLPPSALAAEAGATGPALWATRVRLHPGSQSEYAARLRISQVERAVRGQVDRMINVQAADQPSPASAPPWARNKAGKKPAGPARPADAFFTLTVVLGQELTAKPQALAALLRSPVWPQPTVRIIPLSRKGQPEAGFSAEITAGTQRAFLLYRPQPYAAQDTPPQGVGHVGLFVGGPHSARALVQLPPGTSSAPLPLSAGGEPRLLAALAGALLQGEPEALGLVLNRAGRAWKPREIALNQLGLFGQPDQAAAGAQATDAAAADLAERVPFLFFIDWNVGERGGARCQNSCGMEALGLPDVAVFFSGDDAQDRARDVLWFACHELVAGRLPPEQETLSVPRRLQLRPGSRLSLDPGEQTLYRVKARDAEWLELVAADPAAAPAPA